MKTLFFTLIHTPHHHHLQLYFTLIHFSLNENLMFLKAIIYAHISYCNTLIWKERKGTKRKTKRSIKSYIFIALSADFWKARVLCSACAAAIIWKFNINNGLSFATNYHVPMVLWFMLKFVLNSQFQTNKFSLWWSISNSSI